MSVDDPVDLHLGLDCTLEWHGVSGSVTLNDKSAANRYRITSIAGLEMAEVRAKNNPSADADGEYAERGLSGGRTITIEGSIEAINLDDLRDLTNALMNAFADIKASGNLIFRTRSGPDAFIVCKRTEFQVRDEQTELYFRRPFTLTLRAADPRFYSTYERHESVPELPIGEDVLPLVYNNGSAPCPVRLEITNITATRLTSFVTINNFTNDGEVFRVCFDSLRHTFTYTFDFRTAQATESDGFRADGWRPFATSRSFDIDGTHTVQLESLGSPVCLYPGLNEVRWNSYYGTGQSMEHNVSLYWRDAWW